MNASNTEWEARKVETKTPTRKRTPKTGEGKTRTTKRTRVARDTAKISPEAEAQATAESHLVEAPPDKAFWVNRGPVLTDLRQLRDALARDISDEQFGHHVTEDRNDFAMWVEEVLGNAECANALRHARSRNEALRATEDILAPLP